MQPSAGPHFPYKTKNYDIDAKEKNIIVNRELVLESIIELDVVQISAEKLSMSLNSKTKIETFS